MFSLELHDPAEEIESEERRLSAMPFKAGYRARGTLQAFGDVFFEEIVRHAPGMSLCKEAFLPHVIAVCALEIAYGPAGLAITMHSRSTVTELPVQLRKPQRL